MINVLTDAGGEAAVRSADAKIEGLAKKGTRPVTKAIRDQWYRAAASYRDGGGLLGVDHAITEYTPGLTKALKDVIKRAALAGGQEVFAHLEGAFGKSSLGPPQVRAFPAGAFEQNVEAWISKGNMSKRVKDINEKTRKQITGTISKGLQENLTNEKIAKNLVDTGTISSRRRARTIVRTETHSALMYGRAEGAKATGLKMDKQWWTNMDARARPSHRAAHKQIVAQDEMFTVGGHKMAHPGDGEHGAPAAEIVNCRCTLVFKTTKLEGTAAHPEAEATLADIAAFKKDTGLDAVGDKRVKRQLDPCFATPGAKVPGPKPPKKPRLKEV